MKKIKLLVIFISLLFLSGCSVDYEIKINKDLSLKEKAIISESEEFFETNYKHYYREEVIDTLWERNIEKYKEAGYKYDYNADKTGVFASSEYGSIDEYLTKTKIYNQYFEKINYKLENNIVTLETVGEFYPYNIQDFEKFIINDLKLVIEIPFKVIESNADKIEGNRYIWLINEETKDKKIKLVFDTSEEFGNYQLSGIYIGILIAVGALIIIGGIYVVYRIMKNNDRI